MSRKPSGGHNPYAKPDSFTKAAKAQGYPARSIFKLEEIDQRVRLLKPGMRVLDLGAAPGSWLLYAASRVGKSGQVRGVDLKELEIPLPANAMFLAGDALDLGGEVEAFVQAGAPYQVVLSDMAPNTTGDKSVDQYRSADLVRRTLDVAETFLAPGGAWVAKLFMSNELPEIRVRIRSLFTEERIIRPEGTRTISSEVFLVGLGRRTPAAGPDLHDSRD